MKERRGRRSRAFGLAVLLAVVAAAAAAFVLLLPGASPIGGPALHLLALGADGRFGSAVELAGPAADTGFSLVLAVSNDGRRTAEPRSLQLALPPWFRLAAAGSALPAARTEGNALLRVDLPLEGEAVEPGVLPLVPAGFDRLRLVVLVDPIDCRLEWNGVPAFQPAAPWDADALADVAIYWAFDARAEGQAGLLRLRLPATEFRPAPVSMEFGAVTMYAGAAPRPPVTALTLEHEGVVICGEPERPLELRVVSWRIGTGGRMIVVVHERRPRVHLFDIDDDGRIELEIRDGDGDGVFETRQVVSYPIPPFLIPRT